MSAGKKILIAEDYEDSRVLLALRFRKLGYEIAEAADGVEALLQTTAVHPDLILMDVSMPRMDGLTATMRLKADAASRNIPILILSAHTRESDIRSALEAGADDFLAKPIDFPRLHEKIKTILGLNDQSPTA